MLDHEIAIIGMSGRFPKSNTVDRFWENLCMGKDLSEPLSEEDLKAIFQSDPTPNNYVSRYSSMQNIEDFDAQFFNILPREAALLDPQQRIALEVAFQCLENAGYVPSQYHGKIGVYLGSNHSYYGMRLQDCGYSPHDIFLHTDKDFLSTRIAYKLGLKGPAINIQTACSTSLVSISLACDELISGKCDMALAGASSISGLRRAGYFYQTDSIYSPDGICRPFDQDAKGTYFCSACAMVALKPLKQALKDKDTIHGVIMGWSVNNDGNEKLGFSAPSIKGQKECISLALKKAQVNSNQIGYIEAHGTGTQLGDPIEIAALTKAFVENQSDNQLFTSYCKLGSLKSNMGHADSAAGVCGFIKALLSVKHGLIPPTIHFKNDNLKINFKKTPFKVCSTLEEWDTNDRFAGISSFGIGGTNSHVIIRNYQHHQNEESSEKNKPYSFLFSAKSEKSLRKLIQNHIHYLDNHASKLSIEQYAYNLQLCRTHFNFRYAVSAFNLSNLKEHLEQSDQFSCSEVKRPEKIVFVFPGQGVQYQHLGKYLYQSNSYFRSSVETCCSHFSEFLSKNLVKTFFKEGYEETKSFIESESIQLNQLILFTMSYSLAQTLIECGVHPTHLVGHSLGEYVAATISGCMTLEVACKLVFHRARLMHLTPPGAMLSVRSDLNTIAEIEEKLQNHSQIEISVKNSHEAIVVSGLKENIIEFEKSLNQKYPNRITFLKLDTNRCFHSSSMNEILPEFQQIESTCSFNVPQIPFYSSITGDKISQEVIKDSYWSQHLRNKFDFTKATEALSENLKNKSAAIIEVGPCSGILRFIRSGLAKNKEYFLFQSLPHRQAEEREDTTFSSLLGNLWKHKLNVEWKKFFQNKIQKVPLPEYPFDRKRFWIEAPQEMDKKKLLDNLQLDAKQPKIEKEIQNGKRNEKAESSSIKLIAQTWNHFIGLEDIGYDSDFFELGGDSLLATQILTRLNGRLETSVSLKDFMTNRTIRSLSKIFDSAESAIENVYHIEKAFREKKEAKFRAKASSAQFRNWYAQQIGINHNLLVELEIENSLNFDLIEKAILALVLDNEILRTLYELEDELQQVIIPVQEVRNFIFLQKYSSQKNYNSILDEEKIYEFDLEEEIPLRVWVCEKKSNKTTILLNFHHIAVDGWAINLFIKQMLHNYDQLTAGQMLQQRRNLLQYYDYCVWLDTFLKGKKAQEIVALYQKHFKSNFGVIPTDFPRGNKKTDNGNILEHSIDLLRRQAIGKTIQKIGVSEFNFWFSVTAFWCHYFSSSNVISIGNAMANRGTEQREKIVGYFVNLLPIQMSFSNLMTSTSLFYEVNEVMLDIAECQNIPYEILVQKFAKEESKNLNPLFQVFLAVHNVSQRGTTSSELKEAKKTFHLGDATAKFDIAFHVHLDEECARLSITYNTDLFKLETAEQWLYSYLCIMEEFSEARDVNLNQVIAKLDSKRKLLIG